MKIISHSFLNLHSASSTGGLVHVPKNQNVVVPDDVVDHPAFALLKAAGTLTVLEGDEFASVFLDKAHESNDPLPEGEEHLDEVNGVAQHAPISPSENVISIDGSGSEKYPSTVDWTKAGMDSTGFPVEKGSDADVTKQLKDNTPKNKDK